MSTIPLEKIINGGQALGKLDDGRKVFVWGGLPGERVEIRITKKKSKYVEAIVEKVIEASPERIEPKDQAGYLSTSPWQIMTFEAEQRHKPQLIKDAFDFHHINLPKLPEIITDGQQFNYRNKVEFSWFGDTDAISGVDTLDLAFFRRGSRGKIIVDGTSLAHPNINHLARQIRDSLATKNISARQLKTLLIRCNQAGDCVWRLYTKDRLPKIISENEAAQLAALGGEVIYSDPRSPASKITEKLTSFGQTTLIDNLMGIDFCYSAESFFQVNLPIYQLTLAEIKKIIVPERPIVDLYAGVGTIGLTVASANQSLKLVEVNQAAVTEMKSNIKNLGYSQAQAILSASEQVTEVIDAQSTIIVDPPRAGLHSNVIQSLLEQTPPQIIYLSCNPVTQARDTALLLEKYQISAIQGFNFFPRTPHIESLVILDKI